MVLAIRPRPDGGGKVLIVVGGDRPLPGTVPGKIRFLGQSDVDRLLPHGVPFKRLKLLGPEIGQLLNTMRWQGHGGDLSSFDAVLNIISDADHNPRVLEALGLLLRGYRGRVINRPEAVLRTARDEVAALLEGIDGLIVPKVCRLDGGEADAACAAVDAAGLAFPVIVRRSATHMGRTMVVAEDHAQLCAAVAEPGEYYVIEFIDYSSADGLYRKYRTWSFGGRQVFRHLAVTDHWNIHVTPGNKFMFDRRDLIDEEKRLMKRDEGDFPDQVHATIAEMGHRLGLDYYGVDFGFHRDGRMVLFEANATMSFFPVGTHPRFEFRRRVLAPSQAAFMAMLGLRAEGSAANLPA